MARGRSSTELAKGSALDLPGSALGYNWYGYRLPRVRAQVLERERSEPIVEAECIGLLERACLIPSVREHPFDHPESCRSPAGRAVDVCRRIGRASDGGDEVIDQMRIR